MIDVLDPAGAAVLRRERADVADGVDVGVGGLHRAVDEEAALLHRQPLAILRGWSRPDANHGHVAWKRPTGLQFHTGDLASLAEELSHRVLLAEFDAACCVLVLKPLRQLRVEQPGHAILLREDHRRLDTPPFERRSALQADVAASHDDGLAATTERLQRLHELRGLGLFPQVEDVAHIVALHAKAADPQRLHPSGEDELLVRYFVGPDCHALVREVHRGRLAVDEGDAFLRVPLGGLPLSASTNACVEAWQACSDLGRGWMEVRFRQRWPLVRRHGLGGDDAYGTGLHPLRDELAASVAGCVAATDN
mmetsp:Transcript_71911/g.99647  ORF Transcript_71911/g.99647 Transcript_71911/m.99647 type:complete len:308 (+) Transcript_71911:14-937(+)